MDWSQYTILVVEDDAASILYFDAILKPTGMNMVYATNGIDAVSKCIKNDAIDCVLMDLKIPRLDGFESTRLIRKFRPSLPVIGQSAYATEFIRDKCIKFGCVDFITKPISASILLEILGNYISYLKGIYYYIDNLKTNN